MAKSKKKPKAKPLPAKKKGAKKPRPARGFDMSMVRLNELADHVADLTDRVRALEQGRSTDEVEQTMGELAEVEG